MKGLKMHWLILISMFFTTILSLRLIPLRSEVVYQNPKYVSNVMTSVRRYGRQSLYYMNFSGETLYTIGNNITVVFEFFEVLSGNYVPLPMRLQYGMCDFLIQDSFFGKFVRPQLPKNLTSCPYKAGWYTVANISIDTLNLSFDMPFTYQGIETTTCIHMKAFARNDMNELSMYFKIHVLMIQKPRNKISNRAKTTLFK